MSLGAFLRAAAKVPWKWGEHDCSAFPARWLGINLPPYSTQAEAEAMIADAGGLIALWDSRAPGVAEPITGEPQPGDVGVILAVSADSEHVEIGAIWNGRRWSFVPRAGGIAAVSAPALKMWRPLCPRL